MKSAPDFLASLLDSSVRARLLRVFILNANDSFTGEQAAKRASVTGVAAKREIKNLERLGVVKKAGTHAVVGKNGKRSKKTEQLWHANPSLKHMRALSSFVHEVSPAEHSAILDALKRAGAPSLVILSGLFVGDAYRPADLIIASATPNESRLEHAVRSLESLYGREIRYASFSLPEFRYRMTIQDRLIRDTLDFPHIVLLDRASIL